MSVKKILILLGIILGVCLTVYYQAKDMETTELDNAYRSTLDASFTELRHGWVHYEIINDNLINNPDQESVMLVHGFSIPSYIWDRNVDVLAKQGYRVIRFDLYGRGWSDRPDTPYTLDLFVNQLQALSDQLNIKQPFHLVGLSMGGAISTRFTTRYPKKVKSLSLLAPLVETPERLDLTLIGIPGIGEYLATTVMMPKIASPKARAVFDPDSYPEWQEQLQQHVHLKGYRSALLATARYLTGRSFLRDYEALAQLSIPTQLIWGNQDRVIPIIYGYALDEILPKAQLYTLDEVGHLPQIERADTVNRLLIEHFQSSVRQ